jgi:hypothetical protein
MEKEFVSYEIALKLKELGFDEPCFTYYHNINGNIRTGIEVHIHNAWTYAGTKKLETTLAPLHQQVFRWLRNKYDIDFSIMSTYSRYNENTSKKYGGVIDNKTVFINVGFYETYEKAELAGLQKMIEIIEKK